jgi:hypothetical protein
MDDSQKRIEALTFRFAATARNVALFVACAGLVWSFSNDFLISQPDGFDPLRYEYYARNGLPEAFSDSSSYRMVLLLEYIYRFLPYFSGYLVFISALCIGIRYFDESKVISLAIFSPISFYYFGQTGKMVLP